jgi:hypothetical protein
MAVLFGFIVIDNFFRCTTLRKGPEMQAASHFITHAKMAGSQVI